MSPRPGRASWFQRVPRAFFRYPIATFALYVGVGYVGAGVLHYRIWMRSDQVQTVFTNFGFSLLPPSPLTALMLFGATGLAATLVFHRLFARVRQEGGPLELAFWGTIASAMMAWLPWLFASSVVTTLFLFLFGMNSVVGFAMARHLRADQGLGAKDGEFDPWKMFVNATKVCTAVIALLLGAIATSVLLPWRNTQVEDPSLLRYALLSAYVCAGMLAFIIMPLLARSLEEAPTEDVQLDLPGLL